MGERLILCLREEVAGRGEEVVVAVVYPGVVPGAGGTEVPVDHGRGQAPVEGGAGGGVGPEAGARAGEPERAR